MFSVEERFGKGPGETVFGEKPPHGSVAGGRRICNN
jgi:hypothetical protein